MLNELQTTSIISRMHAGLKIVRQGNEPAAFGLIARMPVSRKLDNFADFLMNDGSLKNQSRSCQSAASLVWQAQVTPWELYIPTDLSVRCGDCVASAIAALGAVSPVVLSVRCDFGVASSKIALSKVAHGPVSPRGGCVASAAAALRS